MSEEVELAKSPGQQILASIKQGWEDLRIGDGHFSGMARLGGHELTQALAAFPDSNIRPMDEPGVFGNPTPQIVTSEMGFDKMLDGYASRGVHGPEQTQGVDR